MDTRSLTQPLALGLQIGEQFLPPAWFYQVPRVDDYWGTIAAMMLDDQISAGLQLRKRRALSAFPWKWSRDTSAAARELLDEQIRRITIEHDLEDALACLELGFSPCEQVWERDGSIWWFIKRIEKRDPSRFRWRRDGMLLMQSPSLEWVPVPDRRVAVYTNKATRENPYGVSVLEPCYPRWQGKWRALAQLERLGEKYSIPPVVALTDAGDDVELGKISAALAQLESAAGVAVSGVRELKQLTVTGKAQELIDEVREADAAMSRVITGQVLALDKGDTGSYAMSQTHQDSLDAVALLDWKATLRKFSRTTLRWVRELNQIPGPAEMEFDEETWKEMQRQGQQAASGSAPAVTLADPGIGLLDLMV